MVKTQSFWLHPKLKLILIHLELTLQDLKDLDKQNCNYWTKEILSWIIQMIKLNQPIQREKDHKEITH